MKLINAIVSVSLLASFALTGCGTGLEEEVDSESISQAYSSSGPRVAIKKDVEVIRALSQNTYKDLAASSSELFLLRADGKIEVQPISAPNNPNPTIIPGNYEAIDYVIGANNTWGLVAIDNETRTIFSNAHLPSQRTAIGQYPAGVTLAKDVAALGTSTNQIHVYLQQETGVSAFYSAGTHLRPSAGVAGAITWDTGVYAQNNYTAGFTMRGFYLVSARHYAGDGHMLQSMQRTNEVVTEDLGNYTEHGYELNGVSDRFTPVGIDQVGAYFYAIDVFTSDSRQLLVRLPTANVIFP